MFRASYRKKKTSKHQVGSSPLRLEELEPRINPSGAVAAGGAAIGASLGVLLPEFQGNSQLAAHVAKFAADVVGTTLDIAAESGAVGSVVVGGGIAGLPESLIIGAALVARHGGQFVGFASASQSLISDIKAGDYARVAIDAGTASALFLEGSVGAFSSDIVSLSADLFDITNDLASILNSRSTSQSTSSAETGQGNTGSSLFYDPNAPGLVNVQNAPRN